MSNKEEIRENQANQPEESNLKVGEIIGRTEMFIEKNKKVLIGVVAGIIVVIACICLYIFWYMPSREKNAENDMYAAEMYFLQNDYDKALKGDGKHMGLIAVADDYSHTKHGKLAHYYIGIIYMNQGKFQDALDNLEKFSSDDAFHASQVKSLMGDACWELGQKDKAEEHYKKAAETNTNNFTTPVILMKLGTLYESEKKYDKALECYESIKNDYPRSVEYAQIEKYIARVNTLLGK